MKCRHCSEELVNLFIDLGSAPPSNSYLTSRLMQSCEKWYPLRVLVCDKCWLVQTEDFVEELKKEHGEIEVVSMGSSLKICLVAEGVANVYPRFAPTMEWDTAAGQGIAVAAGKDIIDYKTGKTMLYNREELLNNWFIVR